MNKKKGIVVKISSIKFFVIFSSFTFHVRFFKLKSKIEKIKFQDFRKEFKEKDYIVCNLNNITFFV